MLDKLFKIIDKGKESSYQNYLESLKGKNVIIYGAGGIGVSTSSILLDCGIKVCYFIDDDANKHEASINNVTVKALEKIPRDTDDIIFLCIPGLKEAHKKLEGLGYKNIHIFPLMMSKNGFYDNRLLKENWEKINQVYELLEDDLSKTVFLNILYHRATMDFSYLDSIRAENQYFPKDILSLNPRECFVDGGAYRGETINDFIKFVKGSFDYIYAFEPDKLNFSALIINTSDIPLYKIRCVNAGLYAERGQIAFNSLGNSASSILEEGREIIELLQLDDVAKDKIPTYIKLDIEGAEAEALMGMKKTIQNCRPKLAISIYHKPTDLWELPLMIHQLNPTYRLHIRHYMQDLNETVCYGM